MPHFVIEYSRDIEKENDIDSLVNEVFSIADKADLFDQQDIKGRAIAYDHYTVGGTRQPFVHTTFSLLDGRSDEQKKSLVNAILKYKRDNLINAGAITVDIKDISRAFYGK